MSTAEQKQAYDVRVPIKHDGKSYRSDDEKANVIMLTDEEAKPLINCGAILKEPRATKATPAKAQNGGTSETGTAAPVDPAERLAAIKDAITRLDAENPDHWLKDQTTPDVAALEDILGWDISAAERNEAIAE